MQGWLLQITVSVPFPGQISPPFEGSGFEQVLVCASTPPPQVLEHVVKEDQLLQPPSIFRYKNMELNLFKNNINKQCFQKFGVTKLKLVFKLRSKQKKIDQ